MKRIFIAFALVFLFSGYAALGGWTNSETGIVELITGDVRLNEIYAVEGIIVGPDCKLTVEGDVNAGAMFISRGGEIHITGKLTADVVYFDSCEGELKVQIGEISTEYYTQCGGIVKIGGSIVARTSGDDGRGIININNVFAVHNSTRLIVSGGVYARGGDIRAGEVPFGDESSRAAFFAVRGVYLTGYDIPHSNGGGTYVHARKGLNATDGGAVYRDYN